MELPLDCFSKSQIPGALRIGYERFYKLTRQSPLPEPTGVYDGKGPAKRRLPYWSRETLESWLFSTETK